jgi:hypothetical protein
MNRPYYICYPCVSPELFVLTHPQPSEIRQRIPLAKRATLPKNKKMRNVQKTSSVE